MERTRLLQDLKFPNDSKILFWVFDGVGGLPHPDTGKTELEAAETPFLDGLASRSACAGLEPFGAGITPGSGPGHMSLFGYDVGEIQLPRGVLEVLGAETALRGGEPVANFQLRPGDLCMRGNYATLEERDGQRVVADRRANKIATELSRKVSERLSREVTEIEGYEVYVFPGKQHRFAVVIRGEGLSSGLTDADPQKSGLPPKKVEALVPEAERGARLVNELVDRATEVLEDEPQANTVLLRGIGTPPDIPTLEELYGIKCAAIATYPMYRGIASLVGMDILEVGSMSHEDEVKVLEEHYDEYDFFYLHIKETDSYGHTGEFDKKIGVLEECDPLVERALELDFDVVVVTGDHCTPCLLGEHSWHPIPTILWSKGCLAGSSEAYTERECGRGTYGIRPSRDILPLALAEAGRLKKFGA
jgi:2,3-bisphosphoglycerate-independent phosphoglycerate mutase